MIIDYKDNETENICNDDLYARKFFPSDVVDKLQKLLYYLDNYDKFSEFKRDHGRKYNIHELHKDKKFSKGTIAICITKKVRMTVKVFLEITEDTIKIIEVSNHYGD